MEEGDWRFEGEATDCSEDRDSNNEGGVGAQGWQNDNQRFVWKVASLNIRFGEPKNLKWRRFGVG